MTSSLLPGIEILENTLSRGLSGPEPTTAVIANLTHLDDSVDEEEVDLPLSTVPPRLEDPATTKRTRGKILDFIPLHVGVAIKKTKQCQRRRSHPRSVSLPH